MLKYVILMLKEKFEICHFNVERKKKNAFKDLAYRVDFKMRNNSGPVMRCKS